MVLYPWMALLMSTRASANWLTCGGWRSRSCRNWCWNCRQLPRSLVTLNQSPHLLPSRESLTVPQSHSPDEPLRFPPSKIPVRSLRQLQWWPTLLLLTHQSHPECDNPSLGTLLSACHNTLHQCHRDLPLGWLLNQASSYSDYLTLSSTWEGTIYALDLQMCLSEGLPAWEYHVRTCWMSVWNEGSLDSSTV